MNRDYSQGDERSTGEEGEEQRFFKTYDWGTLPPSVAVVELIAEAMGCDTLEVPTLERSVDTDALDALCRSDSDGVPVSASFHHAGYRVVVNSDGDVAVEPDVES